MIPETHLYLDIETLPTDRPDFVKEAEDSVKCPASYKKQESIDEWWETEGPIARKNAVHKTGLNGGIARLAAIAWAFGSDEIKAAHTAVDGKHSVEHERRILLGFFAECQGIFDKTGAAPTIVGHCVTSFDIRWIWHRAIVLGVTPPWWWPHDVKPWDRDAVQDTSIMWVGPRDRISLDRLARILGVGGKGDMDGSMVWDAWEAGEHEKVREYCADDVRLVRRIWCRIQGEDAPEEEVDEEVAVVVPEVEVPVSVVADPVGVEAPVEIVPEPEVEAEFALEGTKEDFFELALDVAEGASDEEIVDAFHDVLDQSIHRAHEAYLRAFVVPTEGVAEPQVEGVVEKPVVQRPRVVPVFLKDDFPETEAA